MIQTNDISKNEGIRKLWEYPWKYKESFIIAIEILLLGVIIEAFSGGKGMNLPVMPLNLIIIFVLAIVLIIIHLLYRETPSVKWLSSIPAAISSISIYALLVLLLGFIPQSDQETSKFLNYTGLSHVKSSWPFILIQFYFLIVLGMVTLRRIIPFKFKNIGFFMNHFGLWLTLLAAGLGSSDLKRLSMNLYEDGKLHSTAVSQNDIVYKMPFSIKLVDFNVDQYHSKLAIANSVTGKYNNGKTASLPFAIQGNEARVADWQITVQQYFQQAYVINGVVSPSDSVGSSPAAFITAKNVITGDSASGWISAGSFCANPVYLLLKGSDMLTLTPPEPKKYSSKLVFYNENVASEEISLEVNSPYSIKGWDIYQTGYDEEKGKWSTLSVVEAVRDPWLPLVYFGIALLIAGAVYMFWIGKDKKEKI